jgi:surface protein
MAIFSFVNRSSGSAYFVLETFNTGGFYDSNSLNGALGAYYNFTGSTQYSLVSSNYAMGYVVPPGSSSFEFNPTEYIQTGSVWFRGTGDFTVRIVGEVTSSVYGPDQISNKRLLNTIPLENVFEVTWNTTRTTAGSSTATQVALPLMTTATGGIYNFIIKWGDNTSSSISSSLQSEVTHTYASSGTYTTKMWGTMRGWRFANTGDRSKVQTVNKWGGLQILSGPSLGDGAGNNCAAFTGCNSASFANVIGVPDLRYTDSLRGFFNQAINITTVNNLEKWDISGVNSLRLMFYNCIKFDQNIGSWNTSRVTNLVGIFGVNVTAQPEGNMGIFNNGGSPSIGNWDVSKVTDMSSMFVNQIRFNQNIGNWDVSNVTTFSAMFGVYLSPATPWQTMSGSFNNGGSPSIGNWNTSKVTSFNSMFTGQLNFNQNIGNWDVSKVTTFQNMFLVFAPTPAFTASLFTFNNGGSNSINNWNLASATRVDYMFQDAGKFNQPIGNWRISSVSNFTDFMLNKIFNDYSVTNYDALLNGWASRPVVSARSINFGTIKYSAAASASRAILTSAPNSWTIVDGGQV